MFQKVGVLKGNVVVSVGAVDAATLEVGDRLVSFNGDAQ